MQQRRPRPRIQRMLTGVKVVTNSAQVDGRYLQDQKVKIELYQLAWREILLKKYEGEKVLAAFSGIVPELVTLVED